MPGGMGSRVRKLRDASGAVQAANTDQVVLQQNPARGYLFLQNTSTTLNLWFNIGAPASTSVFGGSVLLTPGAGFLYDVGYIPGDALHIICTGLGSFVCKEGPA